MVTGGPLRIVFFGTPEFAVPSLRALHESRHIVNAVVTQPDRPSGRGQKPRWGAVKEYALAQGLPVLQPERLRSPEFLEAFQALRPDLGVVAAYGRILTDAVLAIPALGMVNVHASLLPKYRGAAPVQRAVMAGDEETGVTIMRVVKALDAGPMLARATRQIGPDETSVEVERGLAELGAPLLVESVEAIAEGRATETPQDEAAATYARKIEKADGLIDWSRPARDIHNQVRGLHPWPHAYTGFRGERIIVLESAVDGPDEQNLPAGSVIEARGDVLRVQTGTGSLRLLRLQREGRRPVSAREFLAAAGAIARERFDFRPAGS